ncbi:DNA primase DnaG [Halorussus litoreus]|uniref:DNA primase DnaG n=1 Tax=Halorussus litoreus TaxID=1710536 RepID=UPI000E228B1E|nr:DNA primase DnaG [Halorussus litoreus]
MNDTAKYVIRADITADGVVERSDVVGAVFGQTEGLLGDDLDLRDLQQSSKLGRIDVDVDSENGQSFGTITIASSLDKVETSILAAALETISRVGPCRATVSVASIEDVRAAKRRTVVDRAKELLSESFDEDVMTSREIMEEVRQSVRVEDIVDYEGLPAGPRAETSDAIVVVEGRADVLNLLRYGVKNAVAVEGTNVPDAASELTQNRTVTVFLDDDRGGDLIRKELSQVGDIDYVAFAPAGKSVEDLSRHEVMSALRSKRPFEEEMVAGEDAEPASENAEAAGEDAESQRDEAGSADPSPADASEAGPAATDGSARPAPEGESRTETTAAPDAPESPGDSGASARPGTAEQDDESASGTVDADAVEEAMTDATADAETAAADAVTEAVDGTADAAETEETAADDEPAPATLREHVAGVIEDVSGLARLLDESFAVLAEVPADEAFDAVESADEAPFAVVVDGVADQRLLDVSAQRGVGQIVAGESGEYVKQPAGVRVRTADQF